MTVFNNELSCREKSGAGALELALANYKLAQTF